MIVKSYWLGVYITAIKKGQLTYADLEVSLLHAHKLKLLRAIRQTLGITTPVYRLSNDLHLSTTSFASYPLNFRKPVIKL